MNAEVYYRPPSEAESFIIRVMYGCPHNKCTFCNLFRDVPCKILPLQEVLDGIDADVKAIGEKHLHLVQSMYFEGGDPVVIKAEQLCAIMEHAKKSFPQLARFSCYSTASSVLRKKDAELRALADAGLQRVFVGLESGSDAILSYTHKGCTADDLARAGRMLSDAGIEMDVSMMLGIGGKSLSREHALKTAALINEIAPVCVRIRTYTPKKGTELGDEFAAGKFALPGPHGILHELRLLVENIDAKTHLLSEHWSNHLQFSAGMPEAKSETLRYIDEHLRIPEESFREITLTEEKS